MEFKNAVSRRKFVGGLAAALGYVRPGPTWMCSHRARRTGPAGWGTAPAADRSASTTRWPSSPTTRTTAASPTR